MRRLAWAAAGVALLVLVGWLVLILGGGIHRDEPAA